MKRRVTGINREFAGMNGKLRLELQLECGHTVVRARPLFEARCDARHCGTPLVIDRNRILDVIAMLDGV